MTKVGRSLQSHPVAVGALRLQTGVRASLPAVDVDVDAERDLVARAYHDPDAFTLLYRRYVGAVYAFAYRRSGCEAVAEDITSATFERALRALPEFRWRGGGFRPWLFRIAANQIADHYRREQRAADRILQAVPFHPIPDTECRSVADEESRVRVALDSLNPRYRRAIALRYLAGLSHEEAADAMGCSKPVMAVILHRALVSLRRALERNERMT